MQIVHATGSMYGLAARADRNCRCMDLRMASSCVRLAFVVLAPGKSSIEAGVTAQRWELASNGIRRRDCASIWATRWIGRRFSISGSFTLTRLAQSFVAWRSERRSVAARMRYVPFEHAVSNSRAEP